VHAAPAAVWRRLLAGAVDLALLAAIGSLYLFLASHVVSAPKPPQGELEGLDGLMSAAHRLTKVWVPGMGLLAVLSVAYAAVFAWAFGGRTLGRYVTHTRLVDDTGCPPTPQRAVVRALLALGSAGIFLGGFWLALFDRRGQTLHDKLTHTYVIQPL
jgi:uncharacterized RDD family membrane protein YckC